MANTNIEWTHIPGYSPKTWNPITGCNKVSPGCKNCYALKMHNRLHEMEKQAPSAATTKYAKPFELVTCHPSALSQPKTWKKPCAIFVNSMSDLFHEHASIEFIHEVFATMKACPQHIFIVLTKRPQNMAERLPLDWGEGYPNVWLGVSIESQTFIRRAEILASIPAKVRIVSAEPLIAPLDLTPHLSALQWVIVGGESGALNACRPMNLNWATDLVEQCKTANVAVFVKQLGSLVAKQLKLGGDKKAAIMEFFPDDVLKIREFPNC